MVAKTYKTLGAPELVEWFGIVCGGYTMKGRDAHMLRVLMDERGLSPAQVLYGMVVYHFLPNTKDIPSFVRSYERWAERDVVFAEAELARVISGETPPFAYYDYVDLADTGLTDGAAEGHYRRAVERLQGWADGILSKPAVRTGLRGGWPARLRGPEHREILPSRSPA